MSQFEQRNYKIYESVDGISSKSSPDRMLRKLEGTTNQINAGLDLIWDNLLKPTIKLDKDVTDHLISKCVLLTEDREEIEKQPTSSMRNGALIKILTERPFDTMQPLLEALMESDDKNIYTGKIILDLQRLLIGYNHQTPNYIGNDNVSDHKVKLQKNYKFLVQNTISGCVCDHLFGTTVISFEDREEIFAGCSTTCERNRRLLCKLLRKDINAYKALLEAYRIDEQYGYIADQIENTEVKNHEIQMIQTGLEVRRNRIREVQKDRKHTAEEIPPKLMPRRSLSEPMAHREIPTGKPVLQPRRSIGKSEAILETNPPSVLQTIDSEHLLQVDRQSDKDISSSFTPTGIAAPRNLDDSNRLPPIELERLPCFHSYITREGAEELLSSKPVGSYLIRYSSIPDTKFAFSVITEQRVVHGRLSYYSGKYILYAKNSIPLVFDTIEEVIEFMKKGVHFTKSGFSSANAPVSRSFNGNYTNVKV